MSFRDEILDLEARLAAAGSNPTALCREAGIARSTWQRWKSGATEPTMASWRSVRASFDALVAAPDTGEAA